MDKFVTYGFDYFNKEMTIRDLELTCALGKPESAWWGSPVNAEFGWKEWCKLEEWYPKCKQYDSMEEYFSHRVYWTLEKGSKILYINSEKDLESFIEKGYIETDEFNFYKFNFFKIKEDYDAIQLNDPKIGHMYINANYKLQNLMNAWDCQSIVVLNPEKIIELNESSI